MNQDILYAGVNDHALDLFEGQFAVPGGMAYNSYVILDEQTAVMDSVDHRFADAWLNRVRSALGGRPADYLIVQHMEPDHSGSIAAFMQAYPQAVVVASAKAFPMMQAFFGEDYAARRRIVRGGDTLRLGRRTLTFLDAPMVHWPEVILTHAAPDGVLFSADAFGKFGALDVQEPWTDEARRYYFGIVAKYGVQVQALLRRAEALPIRTICPLHGPVLRGEEAGSALRLYRLWSAYEPESEGVVIACASIYGHTMDAAQLLARRLRECGAAEVTLLDLARCDMAQAVAEAFRCRTIVLASSTYNGDMFPCMKAYLHQLTERGLRGRTIGLMENGAWAPMAAKAMRAMLENARDLAFAGPTVKLACALSDAGRAQIDALAGALTAPQAAE